VSQPQTEQKQLTLQEVRAVDAAIARHIRPIKESIREIELSVARMSGSLDEHKKAVSKQLNTLTDAVHKSISTSSRVAGTVDHHEAEIAELFRQGKGEKKTGFNFTPSHLTLALWLGLGLVVIVGAAYGVDVLELWK